MSYTITASAELMENYFQADVLQPQQEFCALQTGAGHSLLFSIGSDQVFHLTLESPGQRYGWHTVDLSSERVGRDFPEGATCKTFSAAQAPAGAIRPAQVHLAMVVNDGTNDHLYVSLANSDADLAWTGSPAWTACPFNALDSAGAPVPMPGPLLIADVFISEASDGEFIVVDAIRNPDEPVGVLSRFYLDVSNPAAPVWKPHDISGDIQAQGSASCLGRCARAFGVDGIYTKGKVGTLAQLLYTPLYNAFDPRVPAPPARLTLPAGLAADAIAACRKADNSSDLYASADGGLYVFTSNNQRDQSLGVQVASDPLLVGVRRLYASAAGGVVSVWGLGGSDAVFYLACPQDQIGIPGAWSAPMAIMSGVDAISPYIDRACSANTFFAHGPGGLVKAVKSPETSLWSRRPLTLAPSDTKQAAVPFSSYTTHIVVNGANGRPAGNVTVSLTAETATAVMINHLYYVIGPSPIRVNTDALGTVTIVELARTLAGTRFSATVTDQQMQAVAINPMDAAFQRNARYDTAQSLQSAVITHRDGSTRPLLPAGTSGDDAAKVAQANRSLASAYAKVLDAPRANVKARPIPLTAAHAPVPRALAAAGFAGGILTDLGDLFSWLQDAVESVVHVIEDAASGLWYFVADIAGKVFYGVLDGVEKIVAAVAWVYNAIKVVIEDIIKFLEFLFAWKDIVTTHRVLRNVFQLLANEAVAGLSASKGRAAALFEQMRTEVRKLADLPALAQTPDGASGSNPPLPSQNGAPANLGMHHFKGNCTAMSSPYSPSASPIEAIFKDLIAMLQQEGAVMNELVDQIKTQIIDPFGSLPVTQLMQRFLGIVVDAVLASAENVAVAFLDILIQLASGFVAALTAPLDIPVLSWLYRELTGDELSFLDAACLVAAIPVTLVYKATVGSTPFPRGDAFTGRLLNATSFDDVRGAFVRQQVPTEGARVPALLAEPKPLDGDALKTFGLVSAIAALAGSGMLIVASAAQKIAEATELDVLATRLATFSCAGNLLYVSPNISTMVNRKSAKWYEELNNWLTGISIAKGIVGIATAKSTSNAVKYAFAGTEFVINVVWNVPVIMNAVDNHSAADTTKKSLVPFTIGNFAFNFGGMLELPIQVMGSPRNFELAIAQAALMAGYGVFEVIGGGIYKCAPDQEP